MKAGLVAGLGSILFAGSTLAAPYKSTYTPPPSRPSYTAPSRPSYTAPSRPSYTAPSRPSYTAPSRPSAPTWQTQQRAQQNRTQDYARQDRQNDNRKYDTYKASQNRVVTDSIKKQNDNTPRMQRQEQQYKASSPGTTAAPKYNRWGK